MREFEYVLVACLILVLAEATLIIHVNTKRGWWKPINKMHVLSVVFYPIYLSFVIYTSLMCSTSNRHCEIMWKGCSILYVAVTITVWSFYWAKSKVAHSIAWKWKRTFETLSISLILLMGLIGLCFFIFPFKGIQYNAFVVQGNCHRAKRRWITAIWMFGDASVSALLLVLFLRPLQKIKKLMGNSPKSVLMLIGVRQLIKKNRNLLIITVMVTLGAMVIVALNNMCIRTVHYLCIIERLLTLQFITLTFSYEPQDYLYKKLSCCSDVSLKNHDELSSSEIMSAEMMAANRKKTPSIIVIEPCASPSGAITPIKARGIYVDQPTSGLNHFQFGSSTALI